MSKAIKVTAIVAVIMQVVNFLVGRFGIPLGALFMSGNYYNGNMGTNGIFVYIVYAFFTGIIILFVYLAFMILLINASNSKSENAALEITGIIILSVVVPLIGTLVSVGFSYFFNIGNLGSAMDYSSLALLRSYSSFGSIISGPSSVMMIISMVISLCRKKYVIPLEYEKGYGVSEEYTGGVGTPDYSQQYEMNQQYK